MDVKRVKVFYYIQTFTGLAFILLVMSYKFHLILYSLVLASVSSENLNMKSRSYHSKIDASIESAIDRFGTEQQEKMKAGFTSDARRSYKKTK